MSERQHGDVGRDKGFGVKRDPQREVRPGYERQGKASLFSLLSINCVALSSSLGLF